ncbi:DNA-binding transcriptional regulator, LysR family [Paenibacillus sophorae]|uniref:DNA-binding transcriptional regulator, LysR family n=1 Tax=Paenibacillus sophorae TaxID=1333845 RepID=A0A1H8RSC5_9BACL|nr:LysR family transcriptional regulator [Paenibacillus sophorae]QWU17000.1 LysR family transcriptional regulator [Paenibacillus sophorae]SEO69255.1 DNA-binding transcriptional regulator, LysR family [Paenibacillus sophorae]
MSLAKFEVFHTVVELGSLSQAAAELGLTQSAVSHAIASLESEWGFSILSRGRAGVHLTSNGELVLQYIREILKWNEQLKQQIACINGLEAGTVRIGTFSSVSIQWLPRIMSYFAERHPSIEIKLLEGSYDDIEHWISSGAVDFGFLSLPSLKSFEVIPLKKDRMLLIVPEKHPFALLNEVRFEQIKEEMFIMPKKSCDNDVRRVLKENNVTPTIKFELEDDQAIISMVQNGMGISILPEMVLYRVPNNIRILGLEGDHYRSIGIAAPSFKSMSPAAKKFVKYIQSWLNESQI